MKYILLIEIVFAYRFFLSARTFGASNNLADVFASWEAMCINLAAFLAVLLVLIYFYSQGATK